MSLRPALSEHDARQRRYFEATVKPTMVPADTPYVRRHVGELVRFGGLRPGERVLEIGCGMGRYTIALAREGFRLEGLDLSPVLLERLAAYGGGSFDVPLHAADVADPPAALEGAFDAVIGFFVLHHVHRLEETFAGVRRLLRPGGRAAFLEPNPWNPLYYLQITLSPGMSWASERGLLRMRQGPVREAFGRAGLSEVTTSRFGFFPPFLANRSGAARLERGLERFPIWRSALPFVLFGATRPRAG